jgi:hypothetical protein
MKGLKMKYLLPVVILVTMNLPAAALPGGPVPRPVDPTPPVIVLPTTVPGTSTDDRDISPDPAPEVDGTAGARVN